MHTDNLQTVGPYGKIKGDNFLSDSIAMDNSEYYEISDFCAIRIEYFRELCNNNIYYYNIKLPAKLGLLSEHKFVLGPMQNPYREHTFMLLHSQWLPLLPNNLMTLCWNQMSGMKSCTSINCTSSNYEI